MNNHESPYIIWFSEMGIEDVPEVGGKNASLGEMIRHLKSCDVKIPDGFATTADAHREQALTPDNPFIRGTAQNPDVFFQAKEAANLYYEKCPDIVQQTMDHFEKRLPLRWISILRPHLNCSLAATTGVYTAKDVIKMTLVGAYAVMMTSVLLREGIDMLGIIMVNMKNRMEEKRYESVDQMQGAVSAASVAEPAAFERANYLRILQSYKL